MKTYSQLKNYEATVHAFWITTVVKHRIVQVQYPLFLPEPAPCYFFFFKSKLISRERFKNKEDIQRNKIM